MISICLCIGHLFFESSSLSTKGKRRFCICVSVQRKITVWVAKKPDIFGLFAGDIFFVSTLWRRVWDSNPRGREPKRFSRPPRYDHFDNSPNMRLVKRAHLTCALFMAQKEGFEPSRAFYTPTPLAGEPLRPLGYFCTLPLKYNSIAARRCQEVYLLKKRLL